MKTTSLNRRVASFGCAAEHDLREPRKMNSFYRMSKPSYMESPIIDFLSFNGRRRLLQFPYRFRGWCRKELTRKRWPQKVMLMDRLQFEARRRKHNCVLWHQKLKRPAIIPLLNRVSIPLLQFSWFDVLLWASLFSWGTWKAPAQGGQAACLHRSRVTTTFDS